MNMLAQDRTGARDGRLEPTELALMRAVLEDAIVCYRGRAQRQRLDSRILEREAEHWKRIDDWESPFSFNNVCEALGLNHQAVRTVILGQKRNRSAGHLELM